MTHPTDALRLVPHEKVRELAMQLARSIAGLGYPVGLGVAPPEDVCMKAAQGIFDLYLTAAPASPLPRGGDMDWQDKAEGLESDLRQAVLVAWKRGAEEWCRLNYPQWVEWLEACHPPAAPTGDA